jgi:hypothetical protein
MNKLFSVGLAVIAVVALLPTAATAVGPTDGQIDISGAEVAGTSGTVDVNVFGTLRCAAAGPLNISVELFQESTGGLGGGGSAGYTCLAAGDLVRWVVTADGGPFMVGDKITITADSLGSTVAIDTEDHVLRWGR